VSRMAYLLMARVRVQKPRTITFAICLRENLVFGFDQASLVGLCHDVLEVDVAQQGAEEGNTLPDQDWHTGDDEALDQSGAEELLDGDAAVDIDVSKAAGFKFRNEFWRRAGHLLNIGSTKF